MVITLLGLSGCGKSHLARRIANEAGFKLFCCDDLIEEGLAPELREAGYANIDGVAKWLGQPYDSRFKENQAKYLHHETEVMKEIILQLGQDGWGLDENIVIDTTGSVVYTGDQILSDIKKRSRLIYIGIPKSELEFMFQQYLTEPKPVLWLDDYSIKDGETKEAALARCYPEMVGARIRKYTEYADVTLVMDRDSRDRFSVKQLLNLAGAR